VYIYSVVTDFIDGPIARKTNSASNFGAFMDSAADMLFVLIALFIFIPIIDFTSLMIAGIVLILFVRFLGFGIGFKKHRTFTMLHTYANKAGGVILAFFPIFYGVLGLEISFIITFAAIFLSSLEELIITIRSKELNRNVISLFKQS